MKLEEIKYGISGVYKIIFDNNKIYIGISSDIRRRINEHLNKDVKSYLELAISRAIKKHLIKDIEIIEIIDKKERQKMREREKYWIKYYNSFENKNIGYNMTPGGDGASDGIYNSVSNITEKELDMIYNLLLKSDLTYNEIANKTNSSYKVVSGINNGVHYRKENYNYPLRKNRKEKYGLNNKNSSFYDNKEKLLEVVKDLKENILSYDEIKIKYDIKSTTLTNINQGKIYYLKEEKYPLRPVDRGKVNRRIFTDEELEGIKEYLENSNKTMQEIALIYNCDRKVISNINSGKRQVNSNWSYPLRKQPLKTGPKTSKPVSTILGTEE